MFRYALAAVLITMPVVAQTMATVQTVPVATTAGRYASEATHTSVTFRVKHMGLAFYTARFTKVAAQLDFDPTLPERSKLSAIVEPGSVETDYQNNDKDWNGELRNDAKFFNAGMFPKARFVSTSTRRTGPRTASIAGHLTFLGVTRPMTLAATYNGSIAAHPFAKVPALGFSARGTMKRSHWGLAYGLGKDLADDVELIIEAEFLRTRDER